MCRERDIKVVFPNRHGGQSERHRYRASAVDLYAVDYQPHYLLASVVV